MDDRKSGHPEGPPADGVLSRANNHELSEAEAFLDAVFEHLPHMVFVKDAERLAFTRFNRAGEELVGMPRSALIGKTDPRQLLAFSRRQVLKPEVLDLNVIISDLGKMLTRLIGEDIQLQVRLAAHPALIKADPGQIEQVILNLVVNARDAMEHGGQISLECAHVEVTDSARFVPRSSVMLSVRDTGIGMDEDTRARIFEPFFTTKERGRGTGLGLATAYGIVQQSGGTISVHSEPGFGSTFKVCFPATKEAPSVQPPPVESVLPADRSISVLLVEDEELVRSVARRVLEQHGMRVVEADCPAKALTIFRERPDEFDVVVTDVVMPGMNGPAMVDELLVLRPGLKVLFMSGYTNDALVHDAVLERGFVFLQKPFVPKELVLRIQELAAAARWASVQAHTDDLEPQRAAGAALTAAQLGLT